MRLERIRKSKIVKGLAVYVVVSMLGELFWPSMSLALTSGPAQEEYASFEPISTTNMVDPYTGNFTYNMPLLSVPGPNGGYPINLAYHSGINVEQEASWVGLGWNINVGAINRGLRGLPDDFNGETVKNYLNLKDSESWSLTVPKSPKDELLGRPSGSATVAADHPSLNFQYQIYSNNYRGLGYRVSTKIPARNQLKPGLHASLGLSFDSQGGLNVQPGLDVVSRNDIVSFKVALGANINSRRGLTSINLSTDRVNFSNTPLPSTATPKERERSLKSGMGAGSSLSFPIIDNVPKVSMPMIGSYEPVMMDFGNNVTVGDVDYSVPIHGSRQSSSIAYNNTGSVDANAYGYLFCQNSTGNDLKDFQEGSFYYTKKVPNLAPSNITYDGYSVSGQGTGGHFRPYRSEVANYSGQKVTSITETDLASLSNFEIGAGTGFHIGADLNVGTYSESYSGAWTSGDIGLDHMGSVTNYPEYEPYYFQMYGEQTVVFDNTDQYHTEDQLAYWKDDEPLMLELEKSGTGFSKQFQATGSFVNAQTAITGSTLSNPTAAGVRYLNERRRRANNIYGLDWDDAAEFGNSRGVKIFNEDYGRENLSPLTSDYTEKFDGATKTFYPSQQTLAAKDDQLSEINVLQADGMTYTYGVAALNTLQRDATFRVTDKLTDYRVGSESTVNELNMSRLQTGNTTGVGWYALSGGFQNIKKETGSSQKGYTNTLDEYVSVVEKPPYAHSWLLTQVTSQDYVDSDATPGPSDGDMGYWVKFNYKYLPGYQWRIPYTDANNLPGSLSDKRDNMGQYTYGKKDVYFLESIETKTHIAVFTTSAREDALEAEGEFPDENDRGSRSMKKLDKISLYAKSDVDAHGIDDGGAEDALPVKEVHFTYNYDLCQGIPNNDGVTTAPYLDENELSDNGGKLTLKKVHFTYYNKTRGELSPFEFDYGENDVANKKYFNPKYNFRNMDRWGCYKPNFDSEFTGDNFVGDAYPFTHFPYVDQYDDFNYDGTTDTVDTFVRNAFASAWHLRKIDMPSGGSMRVDYECDDYAYVESEQAMQMVEIVDIDEATESTDPTNTNNRTQSVNDHIDAVDEDRQDGKVWFRLPSRVATKADLFTKYLSGLSKVYFKINVDLKSDDWEFVQGYADFDGSDAANYGVDTNTGSHRYGWIKLKTVGTTRLGIPKTHPFRLAAINYKRQNRSDLVYGEPSASVNFWSLISIVPDVLNSIAGFANVQIMAGRCKKLRFSGQSIMRLNAPDRKYGGGCRVKRLYVQEDVFGDEYGTAQTINQYGQVYAYEMEDGTSSGVAYEPVLGQEESPLIQPVVYGEGIPFKSDVPHFIEKPILKEYYPGQSVGYRRVLVSSITRDTDYDGNLKYMTYNAADANKMSHKSATPVVEHQFYSPYDFPVYTQQTNLSSDPAINKFAMIPGFMVRILKRKARSQGYSVVLNDMAGKPKRIRTFIPRDPGETTESDRILSEQEYTYQTKPIPGWSGKLQLDNVVSVLDDGGRCTDAVIGQSHDIFVTTNENKSTDYSNVLEFNLEGSFGAPLPVFPFVWPVINDSELSFKTAVTHKIIHRSGVLKSIRVRDRESEITTHNLIWDGATGKPVYTSTQNEFEDDIYNFSMPGHRAYEGLEAAYQHQNLKLSGVTYTNGSPYGEFTLPTLGTSTYYSSFSEGDELWIWKTGSDKYTTGVRATVIDHPSDYKLIVIKSDGTKYDPVTGSDYNIQVIRPGHRNLLGATIGNMTSRNAWNTGSGDNCDFGFEHRQLLYDVLQASAVTLTDEWRTDCTPSLETAISAGTPINPYNLGMKGIWRPDATYAYIKDRTNTDNIRVDGSFEMTKSFPWTQGITSLTIDKWQRADSVTRYSTKGFEIENENAIGVYSTAQYGYGDAMVTAIAGDAKYNEILFDGFEDYNYYLSNTEDHWDFSPGANLVTNEAHSGDYSFSLAAGLTKEINTETAPDCSSTNNYEVNADDITLNSCGCNGKLSPEVGRTYFVSLWVKETVASGTSVLNYTKPKFQVKQFNGGTPVQTDNFLTSGSVIEGWQRIVGKFTVAANVTDVKFNLINGDLSNPGYFDDIRIHPVNSSFVSYVYDVGNLKPVAVLDNNNYATFYAYDEEGHLIKTSKETIEGIRTISEGRTGDAKDF